ncbi:hypothetical protein, partial [Staphylococcus aureus]|uniref:hypothetical protein n=1 Tax=Staphylococcus aureus TaxID=1280 RepID=UPI0020C138AC
SVKIDDPVNPEGGTKMTIEEIKAALKAGDISLDEIKALAVKDGESIVEAKSLKLVEALGEYSSIEAIDTLKAEAEHGRAYMSDLIDQAVVERVKLQGDKFTVEMADKYKETLAQRGDLDMIKNEIELYKSLAAELFQAGKPTGAEPEANVRRSILLDKKWDK